MLMCNLISRASFPLTYNTFFASPRQWKMKNKIVLANLIKECEAGAAGAAIVLSRAGDKTIANV